MKKESMLNKGVLEVIKENYNCIFSAEKKSSRFCFEKSTKDGGF